MLQGPANRLQRSTAAGNHDVSGDLDAPWLYASRRTLNWNFPGSVTQEDELGKEF